MGPPLIRGGHRDALLNAHPPAALTKLPRSNAAESCITDTDALTRYWALPQERAARPRLSRTLAVSRRWYQHHADAPANRRELPPAYCANRPPEMPASGTVGISARRIKCEETSTNRCCPPTWSIEAHRAKQGRIPHLPFATQDIGVDRHLLSRAQRTDHHAHGPPRIGSGGERGS